MITIDTVKKIPGFFKFEIKRAYIYFSFSWFSACSCSLWSVALLQLKTWRFKTLNSQQGIASSVFRAIFDWPSKVSVIALVSFYFALWLVSENASHFFNQGYSIRDCIDWLVLLYFTRWLVQKTHTSLSTNEIQNQNNCVFVNRVCLFSLGVLIGFLDIFSLPWFTAYITMVLVLGHSIVLNCINSYSFVSGVLIPTIVDSCVLHVPFVRPYFRFLDMQPSRCHW